MRNERRRAIIAMLSVVALLLVCAVFAPRATFGLVIDDAEFENPEVARDAYQQLALDPQTNPAAAAYALQRTIELQKKLYKDSDRAESRKSVAEKSDKLIALIEAVVKAHPKSWHVLSEAGSCYGLLLPPDEYARGSDRARDWATRHYEHDRVRALQLLLQAMPLVAEETDRAAAVEYYWRLAYTLAWFRQQPRIAMFAQKTDLTRLPRFETNFEPLGLEFDAAGRPRFPAVAKNFADAENDAARWRWALARMVALDPAQRNRCNIAIAEMANWAVGLKNPDLRDYYYGLPYPEEKAKEFPLESLGENETLTYTRQGLKRFEIPDAWNPLRLLAAPDMDAPDAAKALDRLALQYAERRRFPQAAATYRQAIERFGPGEKDDRRLKLQQIVGKWGSFADRDQPPLLPGKPLQFAFTFRNARSVKFVVRPLDDQNLLAAVKAKRLRGSAYEYSQILGLDPYWLCDFHKLGRPDDFLGKPVATQVESLKADAEHRDRTVLVEMPVKAFGAFVISAEVAGGNSCYRIVRRSELRLAHMLTVAGDVYFAVEAAVQKHDFEDSPLLRRSRR